MENLFFLRLSYRTSISGQTGMSVLLKRNLHQRNDIRIALLLAFKLDEIVIGATRGRRKFMTGAWARIVDRALTRFLIQKHASLTKQAIGLTPEYPLLAKQLGKALGCDFG